MHDVIVQSSSYENCREAVDRIFDFFQVDVRGKKVLVKPNALRASKTNQGIVTNPAVVAAIVDKLEELSPAEIIVGDNPGMFSYGANEQTFQESGLMEAAKGYFRNIGLDSVAVDFLPGFADKVNVSRSILEADYFISVPKFKTHGLTVISGAIKNSYGIIPGALKAELHARSGNAQRFHELIVEIFNLRVPDLFIMDAVIGMEGNGPASPDLREIGKILGADNAVALDAVMARMMGLDPAALPFLETAKERGLGDFRDEAINVRGDFAVIPEFKLPPEVNKTAPTSEQSMKFFKSRTRMRPQVDPEKCTACSHCVEQCPVSAISMKDGLPHVDKEACIVCFCCQEVCPEMAITLS